MFLSIVIPVYNTVKYLRECLDSCLAQDIPASEYEIICVDDGSTDNSPQIIDEYAARFPNVVAIHQANGGVSTARNTGIDHAKGEYIWFVDSDDYILENSLGEIQKLSLLESPDLIMLKPISFHSSKDNGSYVFDQASTDKYSYFLWSRIYRTARIIQSGIQFDIRLLVWQDHMFCHEMDIHIKKVASFDRIVYFYRLHQENVSSTPTIKKLNKMIQSSIGYMDLYHQSQEADSFPLFVVYRLIPDVTYCMCRMNRSDANAYMSTLKNNQLFPLKKWDNISNDFSGVGKKQLKRWLRSISYTKLGYPFVRLIMTPIRIKSSLQKKRSKPKT